MTASTTRVWPIDYSTSFLVRGTDDIKEARRLVSDKLADDRGAGYDADEIAEIMKRLDAEVGWWRTNPCTCGDEHNFDMGKAKGPGRGNFRGVYLS